MPKHLYFVGRPYPQTAKLAIAHDPAYRFSLFLDERTKLKQPAVFENVVEMDFSTPAKLLASLPKEPLVIDGLICTYENYIVAKSRLAEHFGVPAMSLAAAETCTDKHLMRQAFLKADPSITPAFGLAASKSELLKLAERLRYPLILKPTNLVKSLLVLRCNDQAELLRNFEYAQGKVAELYEKYRVYGRQPQLIVEEYIQGRSCSIAAFVDKHGEPHFCRGVAALTNAGDIGVDDNYLYKRVLPAALGPALEDRLFAVARKGIAALGMTSSPAHVELIYNDQDVKLIEIGARIGGYRPRMYELSYGLDLVEQEVKLALGQTPNLSGNLRAHCAVYELFPDREGAFAGIDGLEASAQYEYYAVKARAGDRVGPAKNGYKAAAIIIVSSSDEEEFSRLCGSVEKLRVRTAA